MHQSTLAMAAQFHSVGAFAQAKDIFQRLLSEEPQNADLWRRLGETCQAMEDGKGAVTAYREALRLEPHAAACNNLGVVLMQQRQYAAAIECYCDALARRPDFAEAHNNLGIAQLDQGHHEEAVASFRRALRLKPEYAAAHNNLGMALAAQSQLAEAEVHYRTALRLQPDFIQALTNLGRLYRKQGRRDDVTAAYREIVRLKPQDPNHHHDLGFALLEQREFAEAEACLLEAIRQKPAFAAAYNNLGVSFFERGRWEDAALRYRQALHVEPEFFEALFNLGRCYEAQGMLVDAQDSFELVVQRDPTAVGALNSLGNICKQQGRLDEAIAWYNQGLAASPTDASIHSNLLYALLFHQDLQSEDIFQEHLQFGRRHHQQGSLQPTSPAEEIVGRRIRVGYVCPDFRAHVMGSYCEQILAAHDRQKFEIFCYSDVRQPDAVTERLRGHAEHWRNLVGRSDAEAADIIRQDRIDILMDLAGHTGGNRLRMFALRPAPVQATHFAYLATTGLSTMDFRITDFSSDPPGMTERFHTEELIRLPDIQWCYRGGPALDPGSLPIELSGHPTFGCFNNLAKVSPNTISLWARILREMPSAHMNVLTGAGEQGDRRLLDAMASNGIQAHRLTLLNRRGLDDYFRLHQAVDICLDPFPFNGCNTTADALWMGVPVVTLAGKTCVSRQGLAVLRVLGLDDLVAETPDTYVAIAVSLAGDRERLKQLRATLRDRLQSSLLMDPVRFTRHLEAAYLYMSDKRLGQHAHP
jgi:predicted O-linked N-acetylglucosamine transferase (SPINDLY family)